MVQHDHIDPVEFAELYSSGEDPVSMCDHFGVSFEELVQVRKKLGFPPWKVEVKPKVRRVRHDEPELEPVACRYCNSRRIKDCLGCQVI